MCPHHHEESQMPDPTARPLPPPGGHYRHVVRRGNLIFTAGQIGWDDDRVLPDGIEAQTRQALDNLSRALAAEGATLADLVSVTVYLSDLSNFGAYNEAYKSVIPTDPPARASVGAQLLGGCLVEISGIAVVE
jgi:2-iminobutanoate/2-iminopropanoate deaminase